MVTTRLFGRNAHIHYADALVIGSGCAAWNAADCLYRSGVKDIILVSEGLDMGTSRNTGSDKQTYYKLAMQSGQPDSIDQMADALAAGRSVHADTAYVEAANSARCFLKLVELGVPFPTNRYGEYVGYQTDHTTTKRATSAGPLTSKYMTEALEREVRRKKIPILDGITIVELLRDREGIVGAIGLERGDENDLHVFASKNIICATGGPASIYRNTVYPASQTGMTGTLIDCGVICANLQEWQYGIASTQFRWNLSGTYQQVLPTYISVDKDGNRHEFLNEYFEDPIRALDLVFLKGYQWPFDYAKLDGSSLIDLLVYHEQMELGRDVFLDYRTNPSALASGFGALSMEAQEYLRRSDALFGTPVERLQKMNPAAIELYRAHGIDLYQQPLRITVAAQHNNGGAAVDTDWQTNIPGLFVAGEAAGTFGVYRPGGSALNSTQVGSMRAAEKISIDRRTGSMALEDISRYAPICSRFFSGSPSEASSVSDDILMEIGKEFPQKMSTCGAHIRDLGLLKTLLEENEDAQRRLWDISGTISPGAAVRWFKVRDMLIAQNAVIRSILFAAQNIGSRGGSVLCTLPIVNGSGCSAAAALAAIKQPENTAFDSQIVCCQSGHCWFERSRTMPKEENWFETVWAQYRRRHRKDET